ncbi:peptidoglycan recognition protein family protein [Cellulomonas soli]|uniref:peptidoglycan recognition protein family protein n=1 Tax=Cellulomonas soli TaxID=931535 RepID=UPI001E1948EA|nr:peptidoglycan recognition protein [Cellulomonadaceae bacterium]
MRQRALVSLAALAVALGLLVGGQVAPETSATTAGGGVDGVVGRAAVVRAASDAPDAAGAQVEVVETEIVIDSVDQPAEASEPSGEADLVDPANEDVVASEPTVEGRLETPAVDTSGAQTIGVTWPEGADGSALTPEVRTFDGDGWSPWRALDVSDAAPDPGTPDDAREVRGGTDSLWIGDAEAIQLSFDPAGNEAVEGMRLALIGAPQASGSDEAAPDEVDPDAATQEAVVRTAAYVPAQAVAPQMYTRAAWGARPEVCAPGVAGTLLTAVVHHTADSNSYSTVAQAMQQIRNDQAYHIDGRGWCDIGYNFVVDKWGNVYEGRAGSGDRPVIGVHAGGFNTATVGIAMLGDFSTITPSPAMQEAVAKVIAWRLGSYHRDPMSTVGYTTGGGENSRYAAGTYLALPTVIGHRDVAYTACPGQAGYSLLGGLRARARQLIDTGWVNPSLSAGSVVSGTPISVNGATLGSTAWTLTVVDERTGVTMASRTGVVDQPSGGQLAAWDGRGPAGVPVGPGPYRLTLTGTGAATGTPAVPWAATVTVTTGPNPATVAPVPAADDLTFVPMTPQRLLDTRQTGQSLGAGSRIDLTVAGVGGIPADAKAVALNVTAVHSSAGTFVRAWPAGQATPDASILNTDPSRTTGAGTMVGVGGQGKVSLSNNAGATHLVVDVFGYYTDSPGVGALYSPLPAGARVLDTRTEGGRMTSAERRTVQVAGRDGIPADATAVLVNVSSVLPSGGGNVSAFPSGGAVPTTASVNHLPGGNVSNRSVVPLSASGRLDLALQGASADVVLDVVGWYGPSGTLAFTPITPKRAFDTRTDGTQLGEGQTREYSLAAAMLPADARVAVLSLAATRQSAGVTFLSVWPRAVPRPVASDLNTGAGRDQANSTAVPVDGADPRVQGYNDRGQADLVVDVLGYFR